MIVGEFKELVEKVLYEVDPAETYCNENDMFNEYEKEARTIAMYVSEGRSIRHSVKMALEVSFAPMELDPVKVNNVIKTINEKLC